MDTNHNLAFKKICDLALSDSLSATRGMLSPVCFALYRYDHDTKIVTMAPSGAGVPVDRPERAAAPAGAPAEVRGIPVRCNEVGGVAPCDG